MATNENEQSVWLYASGEIRFGKEKPIEGNTYRGLFSTNDRRSALVALLNIIYFWLEATHESNLFERPFSPITICLSKIISAWKINSLELQGLAARYPFKTALNELCFLANCRQYTPHYGALAFPVPASAMQLQR